MGDFDGKVAIVTGGASGIGLACAKSFANKNALGVLLVDVNESLGIREADVLKSETGCDIRFAHTDISSEEQVSKMVDYAVETWGHIDILVNNAGICPVIEWEGVTRENWDRIIGINLTGPFLCTMKVLPHMRKQHDGRIIFVSSTSAMVGSVIAHPAYGVSKAGEIAFMKSIAKEFSEDGILTSAVMPGPTDTGISREFTNEQRKGMADSCLLKRYAAPREVAETIVFLCGPGATFITGTTIQVSGGTILY